MSQRPTIMLFRRDLRLADNPALFAAVARGAPILCLYVFDRSADDLPGAAGLWRLHHALASLSASLNAVGASLTLKSGRLGDVLPNIVAAIDAGAVYWNRRYTKGAIEEDGAVKAALASSGVEARSFNGSLLREPWEVTTAAGGPFRVFTPFFKALTARGAARPALPAPAPWRSISAHSDRLEDWSLLPSRPNWAREFSQDAPIGERNAIARLDRFLDDANEYPTARNMPSAAATSRLSPALAFGEISPVQIYAAVEQRRAAGALNDAAARSFLSEIAWREFSYHLLHQFPAIAREPIRAEFAGFPWAADADLLEAWKRGRTGYPIVDAGMRELWRTGWMHNRVRMIAASFLTKHLLIDWREGERHFRDTLIDYDPANNPAGWQWVAGCGADAAPYFRIFNPTLQGEKFDPEGAYVRRFAPELSRLPDAYLHRPAAAPPAALDAAGVRLGESYPTPIVDHAFARQRALDAYQSIKSAPENVA